MAIRVLRFSNPREVISYVSDNNIERSKIKAITFNDGLWSLSYSDDSVTVGEGTTDVTNAEPINRTLPGGDNYRIEWAVTTGTLPDGVTLNPDGTVTGTPTTPGQTSVTLTGTPKIDLTFNVQPNSPTPNEFTLTTTVNDTVNAQLTAVGGVEPFTWTLESGSLPTGLSLATTGAITGTVTEPGVFNPVFRVTGADTGTATIAATIDVAPLPLVIDTASLPDATGQAAYSASLSASGGIAPYTWAATGLPPGLSMSSGGVISGTPLASGNFSVTITVTDSQPLSTPKTLTIDVLVNAIDITTTSLAAANVNDAYSVQLEATGGIGGYTWSVLVGTLPAGFTLSSSGLLSGSSAVELSETFSVSVTDLEGNSDIQELTLSVTDIPASTFLWDFLDQNSLAINDDGTGGPPADGGSFEYISEPNGVHGAMHSVISPGSGTWVAGRGVTPTNPGTSHHIRLFASQGAFNVGSIFSGGVIIVDIERVSGASPNTGFFGFARHNVNNVDATRFIVINGNLGLDARSDGAQNQYDLGLPLGYGVHKVAIRFDGTNATGAVDGEVGTPVNVSAQYPATTLWGVEVVPCLGLNEDSYVSKVEMIPGTLTDEQLANLTR